MIDQEYPKYGKCPCGSGQKYKFCCLPKGREYFVGDDGKVHRGLPLTTETRKTVEVMLDDARSQEVTVMLGIVSLITPDGSRRYVHHDVLYGRDDKRGIAAVTDLARQIRRCGLLRPGERVEVGVSENKLGQLQWTPIQERDEGNLVGATRE
jgi:hypothetical protein